MKALLAVLLVVAAGPECELRTPVTNPLGLITQPNEHGQYPPGALSVATNVAFRNPGVMESFPALRSLNLGFTGLTNYTAKRMFAGVDSSNVLVMLSNASNTWQMRWATHSVTTNITMPTSYGSLSFNAGIAPVRSVRGRVFVGAYRGPIVLDSEDDTTARISGLGMLEYLRISSAETSDAVSLADGTVRKYRALLKRTFADGYVLVGAVSNACTVENDYGVTLDPVIEMSWATDHNVNETEFTIEIYRTKDVASGADPGETYFLAFVHKVTTADLSSVPLLRDVSVDADLGVELYTNPGQEGGENSNLPASLAHDIAHFNGHTFYATPELPAFKQFQVNGPIKSLSTTAERTNGLGRRIVTGDTSNGSPTVLNVTPTTGLVAGQRISGTGIPSSTTISEIVGSTITLSANATATNATVTLFVNDVLEFTATSSRSFGNLWELTQGGEGTEFIIDKGLYYRIYDNAGLQLEQVNQPGTTFILKNKRYRNYATHPLAVRATNPQNYSPPLPNITETADPGTVDERPNRIFWSKNDQPEAVPSLNFDFVGNGTIYRMVATRDQLYVFCSDGLWKITGAAGDWAITQVDSRLILAARGAVDKLNDTVYAYTNRGLVSVENDVVTRISDGVIGDPDHLPGAAFADTWNTFVACDEQHSEVWVTLNNGASASISYIFNALTNKWTTYVSGEITSQVYSVPQQSLMFGSMGGSSNTIPLTRYFELDTTATRLSGAEARFQPLDAGNPTTVKEWNNVEYVFTGAPAVIAMTPSFENVSYATTVIPAHSIESHVVVPVPLAAPRRSSRLAPGFSLGGGSTTQFWKLKGFDVAYRPVAGRMVR